MDNYDNLRSNDSPYADGKRNPDDLTASSDYPLSSPAGYYTPPTVSAGNPYSGGAGKYGADEQRLADGMAASITEDADVYDRSIATDTPPSSVDYFTDQGQNPKGG